MSIRTDGEGCPLNIEGEGRDDERQQYCDHCGEASESLAFVETARQTHWSPAETELWCEVCVGDPCDPQDREPTEDELEARRR